MGVDNSKKTTDEYLFGLWGLAIHLIVLWGVLDANFHSPIIKNLPTTPPLKNPPAKRLFLFVADGLRYRTFSDETPSYLKHIMENVGTWGVSHTRMPTESRPGNVAIAAGLYEDPSALFKGWKENPVDFDSVFNQSKFTWAWGSPDIIPMFVKGSRQNVYGESYPHDWQDFDKSSNSPILLDSWVFNKYFQWLNDQAHEIKDQSGVIIFFHLLGCDTAGHTSKPHSKEYKNNMRYVDEKIREVVGSATKFFNDDSSAFIFTADHGMTDWGSHGGGSNDETETPVVAWGAGINYYNNNRQDIKQADITPLISSLLGIPIPANNEGTLPRLYLKSGNDEYGAQALLNNINQLIIQVEANRIMASGVDDSKSNWRERELDHMVNKIKNLMQEQKINEAIEQGDRAINKSKDALSHYRKFQRNQLIIYLTLTWLGWIILLALNLTGVKRQLQLKSNNFIVANVIFISAVIILLVEHNVSGRRDWRVMGYGTIAFTSLWLAGRSALSLSPVFHMKDNKSSTIAIAGTALLIMAMSGGMINRLFLSVAMIITGGMQMFLLKTNRKLLFSTAVVLAIYPALPPVKPQPHSEMVLLSLTLAVFTLWKQPRRFVIMEIIRLLITCLIVTEIIDGRNGLSWIILVTSPICISLYPAKNIKSRLNAVIVGLLCPLALLSASYEPKVYLSLAVHLMAFLDAIKSNESESIKDERKSLTPENLVTAAFFMLYILLSFFGTGNMASISSFDPMWTRHFITIFSPFTMTALIIIKIAIPLMLVGCASRVLSSSSSIFMAVLLLGDCLSLPLMYSVTSEGSWLDIGTAIGRYTIAITLPCCFLVLYYLSSPLMNFNFENLRLKVKDKRHVV